MKNILRLFLMIVGPCALIAAHHWLTFGDVFNILQIGGFAALVSANVVAFMGYAFSKKYPEESRCWYWVYVWQKIVLMGFVLLFAQRHWWPGKFPPDTWQAKLMLGGWLLCFIIGFCCALPVEWGNWRRGSNEFADSSRLKAAFASGLSIGLMLAIMICLNYIVYQRDKVIDLSYLKTTAVSTATKGALSQITDELDIVLFYPNTNEVKPYVMDYLTNLVQDQPKIKLQEMDKDLNPVAAKKHDVSTNGQIVLSYGNQRENIRVGLDLDKARKNLRTLDGYVQKGILRLTGKEKVAYFTRGHGEMTWDQVNPDNKQTMRVAEKIIRELNYSLRLFGIGEGSANAVPEDASLVVILAPQKPFMKEEVAALEEYLNRGGNLLVMLEPPFKPENTHNPLNDMLAKTGVKFNPEVVANVKKFVRGTKSEVDVWFLYTPLFTAHEATTELARNNEKLAAIFLMAGSLELTPQVGDWTQEPLVNTYNSSFLDKNRNFKPDSDEKEATFIIGAAGIRKVENGPTSRIVTFADSSWISDLLIPNPANQQLLGDSIKWLSGLNSVVGASASEEDIPIMHSGKSDALLFNSTIFGVPALILFIGFVATRRTSRKKTDEGRANAA